LSVPATRWAARASRSPRAELDGDPVNEPPGASQKVCDLLVAESRVRDDHIPDRSVRLRRACLPYNPNADCFSSCILDVLVSSHDPRKRDRIFDLQFAGDLSRAEKSHQQWEFGGDSPESG
jgi:hypothetical protein